VKRSQPKRDWDQAHEKSILEGSRCRVCRSQRNVQLAHITGRTHDGEFPLRAEGDWKPMTVHPDRVVPLCPDHHRLYDDHRLDLLPHLTMWEVLQAVADSASGRSNGFETARIRMIGNTEIARVA
jgi:hypothetical protein